MHRMRLDGQACACASIIVVKNGLAFFIFILCRRGRQRMRRRRARPSHGRRTIFVGRQLGCRPTALVSVCLSARRTKRPTRSGAGECRARHLCRHAYLSSSRLRDLVFGGGASAIGRSFAWLCRRRLSTPSSEIKGYRSRRGCRWRTWSGAAIGVA